MTEQQRQALAALRFNSAETPDDVWHPSPSHVDGLHARAERRIRAGILDAEQSNGPSPVGLVLQGQKGVGKTHLLGEVRQIVQGEGGYFFLIDLTTGTAFWDDVARAMRGELWRRNDDGELQLAVLLRRLCDNASVPEPVAKAILGRASLSRDDLDVFVSAIREVDAQVAVECGDTIRALALYASADSKLTGIGKGYLSGSTDQEDDRRKWGMDPEPTSQRALVRDISRVLALTGPSVAAIDQLDSLIEKAANATDERVTNPELAGELVAIADGLIQLRETTRRTLSVVACLPTTWKMLHLVATDTFDDRFTETPILGAIVDPELGRELVAKWLGVIYRRIPFPPPHPTWPVAPSAFGRSWQDRTPRQLLRRIQQHAEACWFGEIRELPSFDEEPPQEPTEQSEQPPDTEPAYFAELDRRFARLRERADVAPALKEDTENDVMPGLLHAALQSWVTEVGNDERSWEPAPSMDGQLHAGLRRTLDEERDIQENWLFRAIAPRHGNAVLHLVREVKEDAGIRKGARNRHLVLLRHGARGWTGAVTMGEVEKLIELGGARLEITKDDIRTLHALKDMLAAQSYELLNWLVARKPASQLAFLREILPDLTRSGIEHQETRPPPAGQLVLGMDDEIRIELESLRKHAVIFAGSGPARPCCCGGSSRSAHCVACRRSCWIRTTTSRGWAMPGRIRPRTGGRATPAAPPSTSPTPTWWCGPLAGPVGGRSPSIRCRTSRACGTTRTSSPPPSRRPSPRWCRTPGSVVARRAPCAARRCCARR